MSEQEEHVDLALECSDLLLQCLDGGDFLFSIGDYKQARKQSYRDEIREKARVIIEAYNRFGYAAAGVGECDLMLGIDTLRELQRSMKFTLLSANIVDAQSGKPIFEPSMIIERNDLKVGVIAAISDTLTARYVKEKLDGAR